MVDRECQQTFVSRIVRENTVAGAYLLSEPCGAWDGFVLLNVTKDTFLNTKGSEVRVVRLHRAWQCAGHEA